MRTRSQALAVLVAVAAFAPLAIASSTTIPIDVQATYLITNQDPNAKPATPIALSTIGVSEGDVIHLQSVGTLSFCVTSDCPQIQTSLRGLFSATADPNSAIPTIDGTHFPAPPTLFGDIPTDVGFVLNDFFIFASPDATTVTVPKGANFLFVIVPDSFYSDNSGTIQLVVTGCQVDVTHPFNQGDTRWAGEAYDGYSPSGWACIQGDVSTKCTIKKFGCALTALAMALRFEDESKNLDPLSLNGFMRDNDLFNENHDVIFGATAAAFGAKLKTAAPGKSNSTDELSRLVCTGFPVIVGVDLNADTKTGQQKPQHYVLVTGKQNGQFQVIDPGQSNVHTLKLPFSIRGTVADPPGDISRLNLSVGDNAELLVTDPLGRREGFDASVGAVIEEIPDAAHFIDSLEDDDTGEASVGSSHTVYIFQPALGTFRVQLQGLSLGTYQLAVNPVASDGTLQPRIVMPGIAATGSITTFEIQFNSVAGSASTASRVATFQSTLDDINNSLKLSFINKPETADSLIDKISKARERGGKEGIEALQDFRNKILAQSGKHIVEPAVQILLSDADSLLLQNR